VFEPRLVISKTKMEAIIVVYLDKCRITHV